jgi:hypothetical protein
MSISRAFYWAFAHHIARTTVHRLTDNKRRHIIDAEYTYIPPRNRKHEPVNKWRDPHMEQWRAAMRAANYVPPVPIENDSGMGRKLFGIACVLIIGLLLGWCTGYGSGKKYQEKLQQYQQSQSTAAQPCNPNAKQPWEIVPCRIK